MKHAFTLCAQDAELLKVKVRDGISLVATLV